MIEVIDTHVHFWNLSALRYPWLETETWRHLSATFEPTDLAAVAPNVVATVHVQAEMDHDRDPVDETAWIDAARRDTSPDSPIPTVAVGYADIVNASLADVLDRHQEYDYFRGIRQEAWYNAEAPGELEVAVDLLNHPQWIAGLRELAARNLSFDLLVNAFQLRFAAEQFRQVPELLVVLDHLGYPASATSVEAWREDLRYFKEQVPNSFMKLSGLSFVGATFDEPQVRERVRDALEIFGPERSMLASNFPVDKTAGSYPSVWDSFDEFTSDYSEAEREQIFRGSAARFYRIS